MRLESRLKNNKFRLHPYKFRKGLFCCHCRTEVLFLKGGEEASLFSAAPHPTSCCFFISGSDSCGRGDICMRDRKKKGCETLNEKLTRQVMCLRQIPFI
ncbi:hypothetical protein CEXT_433691 [Caerostris extrusa]|uniref:Uncharacterized protein n=1 Tax=Caerostris extrusa TaxID=172846 RepID=A0AAV4TJ20_CAEEX|nr:hypothetical protein CEXT_433691 [Caerostris extrusa]